MHVCLLVGKIFCALTNSIRAQKVKCRKNLVAGVGAVQVKRTLKTEVNRLIHKIYFVVIVVQ